MANHTINKRSFLSICSFGTRLASGNTGDKAVFYGVRDSIENITAARFVVLSRNPDMIKRSYGVSSLSPKLNFIKVLVSLLKADILLITGGTPFYNDTMTMFYRVFLVWWAKAHQKPVVIYGISLRHVPCGVSRFCIRAIIKMADLAGAREYSSLANFQEIAGIKPSITTIPDPATQMRPVSRQESMVLLRDSGVDTSIPVIGICMRNLRVSNRFRRQVYSESYSQGDMRRLTEVVSETISYLVNRKGCWVVSLPMNNLPPDDDREAERELCDCIKDPVVRRRMTFIDKELNPRQMKGILGLFFATIGVRFHSLVLSSSMHVPVVSIGYDKKNSHFMDYIGMSEFSTTVRQVTSEFLNKRFDTIFAEHECIVFRLRERYRQIDEDYNDKVLQMLQIARHTV
jgi:polysaccharide pyruvyl transferase WcaK-like protein